MLKHVENIIERITKQKKRVEEMSKQRILLQGHQSEEWQESDSGREYETRTGILDEVMDSLREATNKLEEFCDA